MSENAGDFTGHAEAWAMNHGQAVELTTSWLPIAWKPLFDGPTDWTPIAPFTDADYAAALEARDRGEVVTAQRHAGGASVLLAALAPKAVRVEVRRNARVGSAGGFVREVEIVPVPVKAKARRNSMIGTAAGFVRRVGA